MCQVNNERERNILGEEEGQIGREPIWWRRRRKEKEKEKKEERKEKEKEKERERKRKNKKEGECVRLRGKRDGERRKKRKGNGTSLPDLRQTNDRNTSGQETKLVHTTKAMRRYRNPSFSSKLQEVGVFLLYWFLFI